MEKYKKTIDEIIKDGNCCPFPINVIPNNMGINLCSVDSIEWEEQGNKEIRSLLINFIPSNTEELEQKISIANCGKNCNWTDSIHKGMKYCEKHNRHVTSISDFKDNRRERLCINETMRTQINEHCQMVQRGAKPLSLLPHQERYYDEIIAIVNEHGLFYSSEIVGDGWRTIFIYKNKTIKYLVPELPTEPKTLSEHALLGYLLGYNTDSICDYIANNCELDEPNLV